MAEAMWRPGWLDKLRWVQKKKPSYEKLYAEWIYGTLVNGKVRDIEPQRMLLPVETHPRYHQKALLLREVMSLCALLATTQTHVDLLPVLREYESLLEAKGVGRGIRASPGRITDAAVEDVTQMLRDPFKWGQRWLAEFRDHPSSEVGTLPFTDHCARQYEAFKSTLEKNRPSWPLSFE